MGEKPPLISAPAKAVDFTLKDLNEKSHTLSEYKGKIVFLNFWATWCPPCRAEMPSMQKLYTTWDSREFVMLAVDIGESREKVKAFAEENGYTFPILLDRDKKVARKYMVRGIPTTYLIGKDGNIIKKIVGSREWTLEEFYSLVE
jgi:peroxiredoxin